MAKATTFHCSVSTPERSALECQAKFVAFPAHDGEMGILTGRSPLVCKMGIGRLRVESPGGDHTFFVSGGFAQVLDNQLTILTQQAIESGDIDRAASERAMVEARAMKITDEVTLNARMNAIKSAAVQLKIASRN
jgi:F-type H+-transporting ATPase subunit epsilon